MHSILQIL